MGSRGLTSALLVISLLLPAPATADKPTQSTVDPAAQTSLETVVNQRIDNLLDNALKFGYLLLMVGALWGVTASARKARNARKEAEELRFRLQQRGGAGKDMPEAQAQPAVPATKVPAARQAADFAALPAIPAELIETLARTECVLYWGGGISAQAGYPTWSEALTDIAERHFPDDSLIRSAEGRFQLLAELLASRLGRERFIGEIERLWGSPRPRPAIANVLTSFPFSNVVTATWDPLVEDTFRQRQPTIVSGVSSENVQLLLARQSFCIVRLWGRLGDSQSLLLHHSEYRAAVTDNPSFKRYLSSLVLSQPHLFIGASLSTIDEYLEGTPRNPSSKVHYAFVHETEGIEAAREVFRSRHGVELLVFKPTPGWPQLEQIAKQLARRANQQVTSTHSGGAGTAVSAVHLENIGPFVDLKLDLEPGWNVLLGNNGSGKSTILRAISLCLCGDDPRAAVEAAKLLKSKENKGSIEITIGQDTYTTTLVRSGLTVEVTSQRVTPVKGGSLLALAFAPLRGVSTGDPSGPTSGGSPVPVVDDVLPILLGPTDARLTNLKQWIVNLEVLSTPGKGVTDQQAAQSAALRDRFFELLRDFVPGTKLEFAGVQRVPTWQVKVLTDDGEVGIDQVSQGMSSILGWVGPLLQRLYETQAEGGQPEHGDAIVMVDEIDAHLHPEWQQKIVGTLKKCFRNVQFIATTHSPLIVGELEASQIIRIERQDGKLDVAPDVPEPRGMGVAGVLTSEMFGLRTHLDTPTEKLLAKKRRLASILPDDRSEAQTRELAHLDGMLGGVDLTTVVRDPLYHRFVEALTTLEGGLAEPGTQSREVQEHLRRNAAEALKEAKKTQESLGEQP